MSKELEFIIWCFDCYKISKNVTGRELYKVFKDFGVFDYLRDCYDVLHTVSLEYVNGEIDLFLSAIDATL